MSDNRSGWQQRIAAMEPWEGEEDSASERCFFCHREKALSIHIHGGHAPDCLWDNACDAEDVRLDGQNAKDALPPPMDAARVLLSRFEMVVDAHRNASPNLFYRLIDEIAKDARALLAKDALTPAPDASPDGEQDDVIERGNRICASCGHIFARHLHGSCMTPLCICQGWADASPSKETSKPLSIYATCTKCGAYIPHHLQWKCGGRHVDPPPEADASPAKETKG